MTEDRIAPVFPSDFHDWCSADQIRAVGERSREKCAPINPFGSFFFIEPDVIPARACDECLRALELHLKPRLKPIHAGVDPGWISSMQRNFSESFGKSMRVDSVILDGRDPDAMRAVEALGLFEMLASSGFTAFAEAATGLKLSGGHGTQIIRYKVGDYVGPHNDHHPEYEWARDGYVDIQFMLSSPAVEAQYFLHEKDGDFSQSWDISASGGISVFRQPFWHQTTPLLAKPGHDGEAYRWLIGHVFAIREEGPAKVRASTTTAAASRPLDTAIAGTIILEEMDNSALTVEQPCRIGKAPLWRNALNIYKDNPGSLWNGKGVPHRVTCSRSVAFSYANAIAQISKLHPGEDISVVELGIGSGKFTKKLLSALSQAPLTGSVRYVAHDCSERALERLSENLGTDSSISISDIKFIAGDITDEDVRASISSRTDGRLTIYVANYFFDSLPFDIFEISGPSLKLGHIDLESLDETTWRYAFRDAQASEIPDQLAEILYRVSNEHDLSKLPMSLVSFEVLESLFTASSEPSYWLIADKFLEAEAFRASGKVSVEGHQTVSAPVFLPGMVATLERFGCRTARLFSSDPLSLVVAGRGANDEAMEAICGAIVSDLRDLSYVEIDRLVQTVEAHENAGGLLPHALRLSHCDPAAFRQLSSGLRRYAAEALPEDRRSKFCEELESVWQDAFGEEDYPDLCFEIGTVFHSMGEYERAIHYYSKSLTLDGVDVRTLCNLASCSANLGHLDDARSIVREAQKIDESFPLLRTLATKLQIEGVKEYRQTPL